jgi:hypothetical protein
MHKRFFGCFTNILGLLIVLSVSCIVSTQAAIRLSVPLFLGLIGFWLWRVISSRRSWVIAGYQERVYIRLFAWCGRNRGEDPEPDILVLEASEIASMSVRTVEVFLNGPKPKIVEGWLVIEPSQAVAQDISCHILPLPRTLDPNKATLVGDEEGRLTIEWRWWCPALQLFLQQMVRDCPSIVIAHEVRSELDLNGMWSGLASNPNKDLSAEERQKLVQAIRFGFGCNLTSMLARYKHISFRKASAYLAELVREEAGKSQSAVPR